MLQQLANGLTIGIVYALIATGLALTYGVLRILHFAHGGVYMVAAYAALFLVTSAGLTFWPAFALALIVAGLLGVLIERLVYRRLRGESPIAPLIAGVGVYIFLEDVLRRAAGPYTRPFPADFPGVVALGPLYLTLEQGLVFAASILGLLLLVYLIRGTRIGLGLQAVAQDTQTAASMGIDVNRVVALSFFVGSALAGLAGVLVGLYFNAVEPGMGAVPGMKAFAIVVLGGLGSVPGAAIAALALGLVETLVTGYFDLPLGRDAIAFVLLIAILLFRPQGLFGRQLEKV
ncbi:MAG: branched-chain amino acid ABC transporter permease [Chloroflexota bacterium]